MPKLGEHPSEKSREKMRQARPMRVAIDRLKKQRKQEKENKQ